MLKPEPLNPIVQDVKAGRVREYPMPLGVTYGALTQTYEHPNPDAGRDAFTGLAGDGDPVDAVDLSSVRGTGGGAAAEPLPLPRTGDVYPVRVIGAIAMVDGGEADWKVVTVRSDDPLLGGVTGASPRRHGGEAWGRVGAWGHRPLSPTEHELGARGKQRRRSEIGRSLLVPPAEAAR